MPSKAILIVDDDASLQTMLQAALEFEGYHVVVAEDGQAALEQTIAHQPALILLDLMMPRMDGATFVGELEARGLRANLAIIVVSADRHAAELVATMQVDGFIEKPFDIPLFLAEIARLVG